MDLAQPDYEESDVSEVGWSVDQLSRRFHVVLIRYFCRRRIEFADAQDLAQEVFARLLRPELQKRVGRVEGYLFSMAANLAVEYFRYGQVRKTHPAADFVSTIQRSEEFQPDRLFEGREELDLIVEALNELPERMRNIFILARLENLSHSEIATRLGVSKRLVQHEVTAATACLADRRRRIT